VDTFLGGLENFPDFLKVERFVVDDVDIFNAEVFEDWHA
jgi:hypothetical protein